MASLLAFFLACAQPAEDKADDTSASTEDPVEVTCSAEPVTSTCNDGASVVRAVIHAGAGGPTAGDLVVYLTHLDLGESEQGGYYHVGLLLEDIDLADGPMPVELDMCEGGEMWSAEWGDYNLVAILDQDGSNHPAGFDSKRTPEEGEPSVRVSPLTLAPGGESPCHDDLELDCLDGRSCVSY